MVDDKYDKLFDGGYGDALSGTVTSDNLVYGINKKEKLNLEYITDLVKDDIYERYRINWKKRESRKYELKNNLVFIRDIIASKFDYSINVKELEMRLWNAQKFGFLSGDIYILAPPKALPVIVYSERGDMYLVYAPNERTDIETDIKFTEEGVNKWILDKCTRCVMKKSLSDPDFQKDLYTI